VKVAKENNAECSDSLNHNNGLARQNLRGKVSSYEQSQHKAILKSGKIGFEKKLANNAVHYSCKYNRLGNSDEYLATYTYDSQEDGVFKTRNIYNDKNQNTEERIYKIQGTNEKLVRKNVYRFDTANELIETINYIGDSEIKGRVVRKVDKENKTTNELSYDVNGLLVGSVAIKLDDHGNEVERDTFNPQTKMHSLEKKKYDSRNNQVGYSYDGEIGKFECVYQYDDKNNETDKMCTSTQKSRHNHYDYVYDTHCNWIQRVEIVNEIPENVTTRSFQYY
jgi:hypothetical protein